ncbi:MAG: peptidoglycan-binding protein [Clostridiales bacterium]|nr:peptidoglycan-binding protein [Clostridiales bacterium]
MRKWFALVAVVIMWLVICSLAGAEERGFLLESGVVGKVITGKGPLRLRTKADENSTVVTEIPNGTYLLVQEEGEKWCLCEWKDKSGYCRADYVTILRDADHALLNYRILRKGDKGDDVIALKERLQELGYIRSGSVLTNVYNDTLASRVILFQREMGMTEDGVATQETQAYLFSDRAPVCTQKLPRIRSQTRKADGTRRKEICGCCMGEGCECCDFTGWIVF